jgi:hypothetical protein
MSICKNALQRQIGSERIISIFPFFLTCFIVFIEYKKSGNLSQLSTYVDKRKSGALVPDRDFSTQSEPMEAWDEKIFGNAHIHNVMACVYMG